MEKDYLDSTTQGFKDESSAKQFVKLISQCILPEQVKMEGLSVTCTAKNKGESWLLTLLSANIMAQSRGISLPKECMEVMVMLVDNMNNEELVESVEKTFTDSGLSQKEIIRMFAEENK